MGLAGMMAIACCEKQKHDENADGVTPSLEQDIIEIRMEIVAAGGNMLDAGSDVKVETNEFMLPASIKIPAAGRFWHVAHGALYAGTILGIAAGYAKGVDPCKTADDVTVIDNVPHKELPIETLLKHVADAMIDTAVAVRKVMVCPDIDEHADADNFEKPLKIDDVPQDAGISTADLE